MKNEFAAILSFVAIVMSIIAILLSRPYCECAWNGLSIIVAILTILVTVLISWQIYVLIDFKNMSREMQLNKDTIDKQFAELKKTEDRILAVVNDGLADVYDSLFEITDIKEFKLLHHRLKSILYCSKIGDIRLCNHHINEFLTAIENENFKNLNLNENQKFRIREALKGIEHPEDYPNLSQVESFINKIIQ